MPERHQKNEGINEGINEGLKQNEGINEGINQLLRFIEKNPGKRLPEIKKRLNFPAKTLERWIKKSRNLGEIQFVGSKKTGGYIRNLKKY